MSFSCTMSSVEVCGAFKSYCKSDETISVLRSLCMNVDQGSIYGLIGSSGCGKTTLLSCILGMIPLDEGRISILGQTTDEGKLKVGHLVGYMPQETALVGELTVKETVYFFGNIFLMEAERLAERYEMLKRLLELPNDDQKVENCSGGQKRRISFAAAVIHEPDLLILDEPTVGLDPLLREKMWDFLWSVTRTTKLSVIITTHYIAEAQKSDRVGLMRDGLLLAEDSPTNIISKFGKNDLEEAFLEFCLKQEQGKSKMMKSLVSNEFEVASETLPEAKEHRRERPEGFKLFRWQILKALMTKNLTQLLRQPAGITFMAIVPIVQLLFFYWAIGGNPIGLKLAIIDNEINSFDDCLNTSLINNDSCRLQLDSCRFLNEINDSFAIKVLYKTFEEAYEDAKRGRVIGVIEFESFLREATTETYDYSNLSEETTEQETTRPAELSEYSDEEIISPNIDRRIKIYMDQSDLQLTVFIQKGIITAYESYSEKLLTSCNKPRKLLSSPMNFEQPIYGSFTSEQKNYMMPSSLIQMTFFGAAGLALVTFILDRKDGLWNRTMLAGVKAREAVLAQILINTLFTLMQALQSGITVAIFFDLKIQGSVTLLITILLCYGWAGLFFGLFVSLIVSDMSAGNGMFLACSNLWMLLSGMIWPIESFHLLVKYFSLCLPFTLPTITVNDIIFKGYGLADSSVQKGLAVLFVWMSLSLILGVQIIKRKKYCRNS